MKIRLILIPYFLYSLLSMPYLFSFAQTLQEAPFHEAYITPVLGLIVLEAIPSQPPPPVDELIPTQLNSTFTWIRGYWFWSAEQNDFIWISGLWRQPPPGMQWIPGEWQKFDSGWVWLQGFWSQAPLDSLQYIDTPPPEPLDEKVTPPNAPNYFWRQGFWNYIEEKDNFEWSSGNWVKMNPDWILVPAHYLWRPDGYLFIAAYWDWPADLRGDPFVSLSIPPGERLDFSFQPSVKMDYSSIIQRCSLYYPDYSYFCEHEFFYNPTEWKNLAPPWWQWNTWWTLSWRHQWELWWWYLHLGYPQPAWITSEISTQLPPPSPYLTQAARRIVPPFMISPQGILTITVILDVLKNEKTPILTSAQLQQIQQKTVPPTNSSSILKPSGVTNEKPLPKPATKPVPRHALSTLTHPKTAKDFQNTPQQPELRPNRQPPQIPSEMPAPPSSSNSLPITPPIPYYRNYRDGNNYFYPPPRLIRRPPSPPFPNSYRMPNTDSQLYEQMLRRQQMRLQIQRRIEEQQLMQQRMQQTEDN